MKRFVCLILSAVFSISTIFSAFAAEYKDVDKSHWAYSSITKATEEGFMSGMGDGFFGMGQNVTKAQFVSMLCRMFDFKESQMQISSLKDNQDTSKWYYGAVETAAEKGIIEKEGYFKPDSFITREEMAVMLVKALGYDLLAEEAQQESLKFTDVTDNKGYIALAYNFGIISGKSETSFEPKGLALREEAAAMLVRCFEKINSDTDFVHGFYAFSSYSQKDKAAIMDAVSFGWSRMEYTNEMGVVLNTLSHNGNEWIVPQGYEEIVEYLEQNNVKTNLNVYMSNGENGVCDKILNSEENRLSAVKAIIEELSYTYKALGYNPYDGVTIDFENLRGTETRNSFNLFLKALKAELEKEGKSLYVAVQPPLKSGAYFDGYDFGTIEKYADKIIIMAYDYYPRTISAEVMESGFTTTPVTPFDEVYYGLNKISGSVSDKNKLVLGLSISSVGWRVENGEIVNSSAMSLNTDTIQGYIKNGNQVKYSEKYRNPYLNITDTAGNTVVWFENAQSIEDKIDLAKMFGIKGVSVWRLGIIPEDKSTGMDVLSQINK